jgi:hypothetical protein
MTTLSQEQKDRRNRKREETSRRKREAYKERLREEAQRKYEAYQSWEQFLKSHDSFKEALFAVVGDFGTLDIEAQIAVLRNCAFATQGMMEAHKRRMAYPVKPINRREAKLAKIDAVANDTRGNANVRATAQAMADKIRGNA